MFRLDYHFVLDNSQLLAPLKVNDFDMFSLQIIMRTQCSCASLKMVGKGTITAAPQTITNNGVCKWVSGTTRKI